MIIQCGCNTGVQSSGVQDREYGTGRRVATLNKLKTKARCTCCGKEKGLDTAPAKK